ncbi:MAG: hypothetical protein JOY83_29345 [Alphaproteobacteria bacterium]|nr:hypothetical protein [Alphaproteobacteria bacterium]
MIGFTISLDQLKSAPPEVRRWIEREAAAALTALSRPEPDPSHPDSASLAACTPEEAAEVYDLIKGNFLLSQVLFELARETPGNRGGPPLHALSLADMLRHTRLADGDHLVDCFGAITQAFRTVRNDPEASLFGFDQYGQVWIHQTTHESIRALWEQLAHRESPAASQILTGRTPPTLEGFAPAHLGPGEDVAQHGPAPVGINL